MTEFKNAEMEQQRRRWMRPNAHLFIRPDWRRYVRPGFEHDFAFELYERKFSPDQPRVPAGSSDGGQWTSESGGTGGEPSPGSTTEPTAGSGRNDSRVLSDVTPDNYYKPGTQLAQIANQGTRDTSVDRASSEMASDARPIYDQVDAALLAPKGVNAEANTQKLKYHLDDKGQYLGGVTVVNEDHTAVGRMINTINGSPVHVGFEAQIQTAKGAATASFEIKQNLSPGSSITVPWKDFGLMQGPGSVSVTATNKGSLYTGVIAGAMRIPSAPNSP
jgi:hypothetical protein